MKNIYTIILFIALTIPIRLCFAQEESAFYTLPEGAFIGTVTEDGVVAYESSVYIPYSAKGHTWTSIDPQETGQWKILNRVDVMGGCYTSIDSMNSIYHIPQLVETGKKPYQYGALIENQIKFESYVHIGDSVSYYMTPARLICDHTQTLPQNAQVSDLVKTPSYFTDRFDTIGIYFNNIDVMYIEGIRIPIALEDIDKTAFFPNSDAHIKVTIYPAKSIGGKIANIADQSKRLAEMTLTKDSLSVHPSLSYMGSVQGRLPSPIAINGPFVVELTEMKKSGCHFYVTASRERENENYWGYHIEGNKETYHSKFTPAILVKAMFPALYPETVEKEVLLPAEGATIDNAPQRTIYANKRYSKDDFRDNTSEIGWCSIEAIETHTNHVKLAFCAEANRNDKPREAEFVFSYRGKKLTYHLYQPAQGKMVVRDGLTKSNLGTICLPFGAREVTGASLWEIAYKTEGKLVLEESKTMEAGMPYVFEAEGEKIECTPVGLLESVEDWGESLAKNGLHGTLEVMRDEALEGKYVIANNEFVKCGSGCELGANRAYMVFDEVPTAEPPSREGVRRMAMKMGEVTELKLRVESVEFRDNCVPRKLYGADGRMYINVNGQVIGMDGSRHRMRE